MLQTVNVGDKRIKYLDREDIMKENKNKMYLIAIGQCVSSLKSTIKGGAKYISKSIF